MTMMGKIKKIFDEVHIEKLFSFPTNWQELEAEEVCLVGLGKVAYLHTQLMAKHLCQIKHKVVIVPEDFDSNKASKTEVIKGSHPFMQQNSFQAGNLAYEIIEKYSENSSLVVCLSGGGSALLEMPGPNLSMSWVMHINLHLFKCGAPIEDINHIRMAISGIKNGGLLLPLHSKKIYLSILCDIPSGDSELVASRPFMYRPQEKVKLQNLAKRWLEKKDQEIFFNYLDSIAYQDLQEQKKRKMQKIIMHQALVADGTKVVAMWASPKVSTLGVLNCSFEEGLKLHLEYMKKNMGKESWNIVSSGEIPVKVSDEKKLALGEEIHILFWP